MRITRRGAMRGSAALAVGGFEVPGIARGDDHEWPGFGSDPANTGHAPGQDGPASDVEKQWVAETDAGIRNSSPAVAAVPADGGGSPDSSGGRTVFLGDEGGTVYAFDAATGEIRWSADAGGGVRSSPAVARSPEGDGGAVYVGSEDGHLYAFDAATGDRHWRYDAGGAVRSSPAVVAGRGDQTGDGDPAVYVGSLDGSPGSASDTVHAVDPATGEARWTAGTDPVPNSPAVTGGTVHVADISGSVHALDATTGETEWSTTVGTNVFSSPAVAGDALYLGSDDGTVYALDRTTGEEGWRFRTNDRVSTSPAVGADAVYVGSHEESVLALDRATGDPLWAFETDAPVFSSPSVVGDAVYVGDGGALVDEGAVHAIDRETGERRWSLDTGGWVQTSPAVVSAGDDPDRGTVVVGNRQGQVVAITGDTVRPESDDDWGDSTGSFVVRTTAGAILVGATGKWLYSRYRASDNPESGGDGLPVEFAGWGSLLGHDSDDPEGNDSGEATPDELGSDGGSGDSPRGGGG